MATLQWHVPQSSCKREGVLRSIVPPHAQFQHPSLGVPQLPNASELLHRQVVRFAQDSNNQPPIWLICNRICVRQREEFSYCFQGSKCDRPTGPVPLPPRAAAPDQKRSCPSLKYRPQASSAPLTGVTSRFHFSAQLETGLVLKSNPGKGEPKCGCATTGNSTTTSSR